MRMKLRDPREHPYKHWVIDMEIDPHGAYEGIEEGRLFDACGLLPYFVAHLSMQNDDYSGEAADAMEILNNCYGFGLGDYNMLDSGGEVDEQGLYTYPDDPDMSPLIEFQLTSGVTVWIYQHALVCVRDADGNTIMQRMD